MRTFKRHLAKQYAIAAVAAVAIVGALSTAISVAQAGNVTFRSPEDALKVGVSAYNGGFYEIAVPALEAVGADNAVLSRYYLARIYSDNDGAYTDHVKAYKLFRALADQLGNVDVDDDPVAPIAAASLTAVSSYLRRGLPEAGVKPDVAEADRALHKAALFFNDENAQFELAKVLMRGEGPDVSMRTSDDPEAKIEIGRHWLSRLSQRGHPSAQAFLADLMWRGKFVKKDQIGALNLIDVALANAPPHERVWIADTYQNIYCNAGEGVRQQATGRVAEWRDRYGRGVKRAPDRDELADLTSEPERTCANGEPVIPMADGSMRAPAPAEPSPSTSPASTLSMPSFVAPATSPLASPGPPSDLPSSARGTDAGYAISPQN